MGRHKGLIGAILIVLAAGLLFWVHEYQFLPHSDPEDPDEMEQYILYRDVLRFVRGVTGMLVMLILLCYALFWNELRAIRRDLEDLDTARRACKDMRSHAERGNEEAADDRA